MKILISGGGIAGCVLGYFLKKYGFDPIIIESNPEFKETGCMITFNRQLGQEIVKKMDVFDEVMQLKIPYTKVRWNHNIGQSYKPYEFTPTNDQSIFINRAELHSVLYSKVKANVEFRFDQQIKTIKQGSKNVAVTFSKGNQETYDLIIAAEGVNSKTRELVFGNQYKKYLGQEFFAFSIPVRKESVITKERKLDCVFNKGLLMSYGIQSAKHKMVGGYLFHEAQPFVPIKPSLRYLYMLEHFGNDNKNFKLILDTLTNNDYIFHGQITQIVMPTWHANRVCLVGDTAYCVSPTSNVGATLAMAGAYELAKQLSQFSATKDYQKAFQNYELHMRPSIEHIQKRAINALTDIHNADHLMNYQNIVQTV